MTDTTPIVEPAVITAGDTAKWKIYAGDYLPADGWVMTYAFVKTGTQLEITGTDNGDGYHLLSVAAVTTAAWAVGDYRWQSYVTKAATSERYTVRRGEIEIRADFAQQDSGYDGRGDWQKIVDQIEAAIISLTTTSATTASISWNGRSVTYRSTEDLYRALSFAKTQAHREEQAQRLRDGLPAGNRIQIRF